MAIEWINWIFGDSRGTPPLTRPKNANRLVLLALANHANADGWCFPKISLIQSETALSEKSIKSAVTWLIEEGYVTRDVNNAPLQMIGDPRRRPNLYRLLRDAEVDPGGEELGSPGQFVGGKNRPAWGGQIVPDGQLIPLTGTISRTVNDSSREIEFTTFWDRYPRKTGKPKAAAAFRSARKRVKLDVILDGLARWIPYWAANDPKFIPYPTTWLNSHAWDDEVPTAGRAKQTSGWDALSQLQCDDEGRLIDG